MDTGALLVGVLVGWASSAVWRSAGMGNAWVDRLVGVVGGLIGAYLAGLFGGGEALAVAVWAWAGAVIVSDLVAMTAGGKG